MLTKAAVSATLSDVRFHCSMTRLTKKRIESRSTGGRLKSLSGIQGTTCGHALHLSVGRRMTNKFVQHHLLERRRKNILFLNCSSLSFSLPSFKCYFPL